MRFGSNFHELVHALLHNPSGLIEIALAEVALQFPAVFTGVVPGKDFPGVAALVQL